ncbi:MAG TPA: hypothetical protein VMX97_07625 [Hyphomicrobiaceae bacterium]|nr:hypothetical protein [Hyphomicrobiaceae bacterium]
MRNNKPGVYQAPDGPPDLRSLMSLGAFRKALQDGHAPEPGRVLLRKQFAVEVKQSEEDPKLYEFTISTNSIDRDDDRISVEGWDFKNFLRNPVMLWVHDYRGLPIGRAKDLFAADGKMKSIVEFTPELLYPFGDQVRRFYEAGFLNAVSVGFLPRKWAFVDNDERKYGIDFEEQELLEFSGVPVPSNPDALMERDLDEGKSAEQIEAEIAAIEDDEPDGDQRARDYADELSRAVIPPWILVQRRQLQLLRFTN